MYQDEEEARRVMNQAIDLGITYLDTAISFGDGLPRDARRDGDENVKREA